MKNDTSKYTYRMPVGIARNYLRNRSGDEKKQNNQEYLCKMVNQEHGLKGTCVRVIIGDDSI